MITEQEIRDSINFITKKYLHLPLTDYNKEKIKLDIFFYINYLFETNQIEIIPKNLKVYIQAEPNTGYIDIKIPNDIYLFGEENIQEDT